LDSITNSSSFSKDHPTLSYVTSWDVQADMGNRNSCGKGVPGAMVFTAGFISIRYYVFPSLFSYFVYRDM